MSLAFALWEAGEIEMVGWIESCVSEFEYVSEKYDKIMGSIGSWIVVVSITYFI